MVVSNNALDALYPCYTDLELLLSSSGTSDAIVHAGDVGLIIELPNVWKTGPGVICGVLFGDKKKYLNFNKLQLLRAGNESGQHSKG